MAVRIRMKCPKRDGIEVERKTEAPGPRGLYERSSTTVSMFELRKPTPGTLALDGGG